jgi:hypothetical protein
VPPMSCWTSAFCVAGSRDAAVLILRFIYMYIYPSLSYLNCACNILMLCMMTLLCHCLDITIANRKPTTTDLIIHKDSCHPYEHKKQQ